MTKPAKPKKIGRPSSFTQEIADEICERLATGESLRTICDDNKMPDRRTVRRWLAAVDDCASPWAASFRHQYARAREDQAEHYADEIVGLADRAYVDHVDPDSGLTVPLPVDHNRSRLQIDARKWYASKLAPKKYGDSVKLVGDPDQPLRIEEIKRTVVDPRG